MAMETPGKGRKPPPKCKAILLCDHVIADPATAKISVIGIFSRWAFPHFPHSTPPFRVFLQLTDGIGSYVISMEVLDLQDFQIVAHGRIAEIDFTERKNKVDLGISIPPLLIPHAGSYDFIVLADGQEVDRQQFQATQTAEGPSHGAEKP